jgi:hypothetical protein
MESTGRRPPVGGLPKDVNEETRGKPLRPIIDSLPSGALACCDTYHNHLICSGAH